MLAAASSDSRLQNKWLGRAGLGRGHGCCCNCALAGETRLELWHFTRCKKVLSFVKKSCFKS